MDKSVKTFSPFSLKFTLQFCYWTNIILNLLFIAITFFSDNRFKYFVYLAHLIFIATLFLLNKTIANFTANELKALKVTFRVSICLSVIVIVYYFSNIIFLWKIVIDKYFKRFYLTTSFVWGLFNLMVHLYTDSFIKRAENPQKRPNEKIIE